MLKFSVAVSPILGWFLILAMFAMCESQPRPNDMNNCKLNASSPFAWLVHIWDASKSIPKEKGTASFGSLITSRSVLTSAWYYRDVLTTNRFRAADLFKRLTVIGHNIWDYTTGKGREEPCYQSKKVKSIQYHPKSQEKGEGLFFDFSIIVLHRPFEHISEKIPVMYFPSTALDLLLAIRFLNTNPSRAFCALPVPEIINDMNFVLNDRIDSQIIPFRTECIKLLCEQKGPTFFTAQCEDVLKTRLNGTVICVHPAWTTKIHLSGDPPFPNGFAGVPIVCNGSSLGIVTQVKARFGRGYESNPRDFFFVLTLLRIYPWLLEKVEDTSHDEEPFSSDSQNLKEADFPPPSRKPTPDWGLSQFFRLSAAEHPFPPPHIPPSNF